MKIYIVITTLLLTLSASVAAKTVEELVEELGINPNVSYDATRIIETKEGRIPMKVNHAPGKERTEMQLGGMASYSIMREDQQKLYSVMPSQGMYSEIDMNSAEFQDDQPQYSNIEKVGTEVIQGFNTTKLKVKFKDKEGKGAGFLWLTDHGINLKSEMIYAGRKTKRLRMTMELENLKIRPQDPALFVVPAGLQKLPTGGLAGMMKAWRQESGSAANQQPEAQDSAAKEPGFAGEVAGAAGEAAKEATKAGAANEARKAVRKGFKKVFGL